MRARNSLLLAVIASLGVSGCGHGGLASTVHRAPAHLEVLGEGHAVGLTRFVPAATSRGRRFMAPAELSRGSLDVTAPKNEPPNQVVFGAPRGDSFAPTVTATINRPDHVELVAVGRAGEAVSLGWEESCGFVDHGHSAIAGASAEASVRLPTVVLVTLPRWSTGGDDCYMTATAASPRLDSVKLAIVNY